MDGNNRKKELEKTEEYFKMLEKIKRRHIVLVICEIIVMISIMSKMLFKGYSIETMFTSFQLLTIFFTICSLVKFLTAKGDVVENFDEKVMLVYLFVLTYNGIFGMTM